MITNTNHEPITFARKTGDHDDEMVLIADCLESIRKTAEFRSGICKETREELEHYLGLAEAALRRAHAESKLC